MTQRPFGWTGVQVPVIGQGTWMIEGSADAERRAIDALRAGIDLGLTHIDTAEMYGSGRAEELAGKAIAGRARPGVPGKQSPARPTRATTAPCARASAV